MRLNTLRACIALLLLTHTGTAAAASGGQPPGGQAAPRRAATASWPEKVIVTAGGALQSASASFGETHSEVLNVEQSTWDARYGLDDNVGFMAGVGVRVWRNLLAGVSYSHFTQSGAAVITGQIPHPFFFDQLRPLEGEATLQHQEQAVHVSLQWVAPLGRRMELAVSGGPSLFAVKREFVEDVNFVQEYPFDTVQFTTAASRDVTERAIGAHAGADLTWLLAPRLGISVLVRYSRAAVAFDTPAGGSVSLDAGGLQTGIGLRVGLGRRSPISPPPPPPRSPDEPKLPPGQVLTPRPVIASGLIITAAPVYLRPDTSRAPLRTLGAGIRVKVLDETPGWLRIEFADSRFGPRIGYVERKHVQVSK
jgi:hypothetical protein